MFSIERCLARGTAAANSKRTDDNEESLKKRFVTFTNATQPVINHFDEQNIGNARAMRDLNGYLRETGAILDQKRSFSKLDRSSFLQKMEEVLQRLKRI